MITSPRPREPREVAAHCFEILRLELELIEQFASLGPEAAQALDYAPCDPERLFSLLQRAESAWSEAGEPALQDRDYVMARLARDEPNG